MTGVNVTTRGAMLDNGTLDATLATFTITEERKKSYNFSRPYYTDHIGVLVKKSSGIDDLEGLNGKTVGVALSATTRDKLTAAGDELGIHMNFAEYSTYPEIKIALVAGRVDAFSVDSSILKGYLDDSTKLLDTHFAPQEYGVATRSRTWNWLGRWTRPLPPCGRTARWRPSSSAGGLRATRRARTEGARPRRLAAGRLPPRTAGVPMRRAPMARGAMVRLLAPRQPAAGRLAPWEPRARPKGARPMLEVFAPFKWEALVQRWPDLLAAFGTTVGISALALLMALALGILFGVLSVSRVAVLRGVTRVYVEVVQNVPLLLQVFVLYAIFPLVGFTLAAFWIGVLAIGIYHGGYMSEVVRSGIGSIHRGQFEAARSQGFGYWQTMFLVVLPQAFRIILPPLAVQAANLVKNTSVLALID